MLIKKKLIKLFAAIGLIVTCSGTLYADYDVNNLNNLFTSKSQRERIDAARSGKVSPESKITNKISVEGYMTRSDGKSVAWLNNKNTLESTKIDNVKVHQISIGKNKKITVSVDNKTTKIRPGETWYEEKGEIVGNQ